MKIIRNIYLLITLVLTVQTNTSFAMQNIAAKITGIGLSSLCSGFELMCAFNPLWTSYFIHCPAMLAKKEKEYHSNASEKIMHFVQLLKEKRNINQNIHVIIKENGHRDYSMASHKNILYIPPMVSKELEELLAKKELTQEEQIKLNRHIASVHHELTHLKNDDTTNTFIRENVIGTIGSAIITETINQYFIKQVPFLNNNFIAHNALKIGRGIGRIVIARYIINSNPYEKYAELRADDGIPNEKALLESQVNCFHQEHEELLSVIDDIKSSSYQEIINRPETHRAMLNTLQVFAMKILPKEWFNIPFITNIVCYARATHPCGRQRELRFLQRIATLDKETLTKPEKTVNNL